MKTKIYHGTSRSNLESILKDGLDSDYSENDTIWTCSDVENSYFYELKKTMNADCLDTLEEAKETCIRRAIEQAQIGHALYAREGNDLIVLEYEIDEKYLSDDDSCPNMEDIACQVSVEDIKQHAKLLNVYVSADAYNPHFRFFYISSLVQSNEYLNSWDLDEMEREACQLISDAGIYIEDLMYFEWKKLENWTNV